MTNALGPDQCVTLPMVDAFTSCDTVSCFGSRGKRSAWDMWSAFAEVTPALCTLAATPETVDNWLCPRERLLVLLYACTSSQEFVNGAREQFTQKGRAIVLRHKQYLSSTQSGLLSTPVTVGHRRWSQLRSFHLQVNGGGTETLMTAGQLFLNRYKWTCRELLRCGCNKLCVWICKCLKRRLQCTPTVVDCVLVANVWDSKL